MARPLTDSGEYGYGHVLLNFGDISDETQVPNRQRMKKPAALISYEARNRRLFNDSGNNLLSHW